MARIYTKSGDKGETSLVTGERVDKTSLRIKAIGNIDELNSFIGVALSTELPLILKEPLTTIQHHLFDIGGEVATPGFTLIQESRVKYLEDIIDDLSSRLDSIKEFILPGGTIAASHLHVARSVCRRAEIATLALTGINPITLKYLNRLSDVLFTLARYANKINDVDHVYWKQYAS